MFRSFGHEKSSIVNGGLPCWEDEGYLTETITSQIEVTPTKYPTPEFDASAIRSTYILRVRSLVLLTAFLGYEQIVANSLLDPLTDSNAELVLDARSRGRYVMHLTYNPVNLTPAS